MEPVVQALILKLRIDLPDVLLQDNFGVLLDGLLTVLVVVYALPSVTLYHISAKQADGLDGNLSLSRPLL